MEPDSPKSLIVGGILSSGQDTDGERTDDDLDFPSHHSYVSQHEQDPDEEEEEELEVTGEGTAGGPFGLKRVLFVRKKSDKGAGSKEEPSFKDRFSKLGAGVGERFAAFGNIIQEHSIKSTTPAAAAGGTASKVVETISAADRTNEQAQTAPQAPGAAPTALAAAAAAPAAVSGGPAGGGEQQPQRVTTEYFQEYEITFSSKPKFSLVGGADGKGAVVSWNGAGDAAASGPRPGAAVIAVAGESVVDRSTAEVAALLSGGGGGGGENNGSSRSISSDRREVGGGRQTSATADKDGEGPKKLSVKTPTDSEGCGSDGGESSGGSGAAAFPLLVRFREKTGPGGPRQHEAGTAAGGEVFRSRMKAMATGLGNFFQVKDTAGSVVRDGSEHAGAGDAGEAAAAAAAASDAFVLTFAAGSGGAEDLPFTMADAIGGLGVIVAAVRDDYAESLVTPEEAGVISAGTAGVAETAAAAASGGGGGVSDGGQGAGESGLLKPGSLLLRVAGQNVERKGLQRVCKILEAAAAEHSVVIILFRHAPPIFRGSVAGELALEQARTPHVHVGTWQPLLKRRAGITLGGGGGGGDGEGGGGSVIGLGYGGEEWDDVQATMARAHRFVDSFRSVGIRVDILSMQTVTLPRNVKSAYAGTFEGRPSSFQQAARLWFRFPDERTVSIQRQATLEKLGLLHVDARGSALGTWVVVTAADASPCAEAGVPVGENSILTHVNGFDVSPAAYRSLAPLPFGEGQGWAAAVLPALESGGGDTISLTFV